MRADYLNENSSSSYGFQKKVQGISATKTLNGDDSGKELYVTAGGAYSITLPTGADIENGVNYKFWVAEGALGAAVTIAAGSAIVFGKINEGEVDTGDDAPGSSGSTGVSNVILGTSADKGDFIEIVAYGGEWYMSGQTAVDGAVTTS